MITGKQKNYSKIRKERQSRNERKYFGEKLRPKQQNSINTVRENKVDKRLKLNHF